MSRLLRLAAAVGAGAVAMYLLDPDRGHRRRNMLRDRGRARVRRICRQTNRLLRRQVMDCEHRMEGAMVRALGGGKYYPDSDVDLREHLRQVIAGMAFVTKDVNVELVKGVTTLRGQLDTAYEQQRLVTAIEEVAGVKEVRSYLHLPGTAAPNKEPALRAVS